MITGTTDAANQGMQTAKMEQGKWDKAFKGPRRDHSPAEEKAAHVSVGIQSCARGRGKK